MSDSGYEWPSERSKARTYQSRLIKRLSEIMPKKPENTWDGKKMMEIEMHPIRKSADLFASWMGNEKLLPANNEELRATLWVFGEILYGEMERMLNVSNRLQDDLLKTQYSSGLQISDQLAEKLSTDTGIRVEDGIYELTAGRSLKGCKVKD